MLKLNVNYGNVKELLLKEFCNKVEQRNIEQLDGES